MQKLVFIFLLLLFVSGIRLSGQNAIYSVSVKSDTILNIIVDEDFQFINPGIRKEYSINRYNNIDFLKVNLHQLDATGLHSEVYISNTHRGVIIISSAEPNNTLTNFNFGLQSNPTYYDTFSRRDTLVVSPGVYNGPVFDFTKASSLRQDYINAYNYSIDPRTGISWSKTSNDIFKQDWGLGQSLYDLIMVLPKVMAK